MGRSRDSEAPTGPTGGAWLTHRRAENQVAHRGHNLVHCAHRLCRVTLQSMARANDSVGRQRHASLFSRISRRQVYYAHHKRAQVLQWRELVLADLRRASVGRHRSPQRSARAQPNPAGHGSLTLGHANGRVARLNRLQLNVGEGGQCHKLEVKRRLRVDTKTREAALTRQPHPPAP